MTAPKPANIGLSQRFLELLSLRFSEPDVIFGIESRSVMHADQSGDSAELGSKTSCS